MYYDKPIKISTGGSRKATSWVVQDTSWSAFLARLSQPVRTPETFQEYKALPKPRQDDLKDVGGFVGGVLAGPRCWDRWWARPWASTSMPPGTRRSR